MKIAPHPHWPQKEPETLEELREYLAGRFDFLFGNEENQKDVQQVLHWLREDPEKIFEWSGADSFFTLFTPFHTGIPFLKSAMQHYRFPEELKNFLTLCTSLEKQTDQFIYNKTAEELKNKQQIIQDLTALCRLMPTHDVFAQWLSDIRN